MTECDRLLRDIDKLMDANTMKFMEAVHATLQGLLEGMLDLDKRLRVIEATNRGPKGTEDGDSGTRGNK